MKDNIFINRNEITYYKETIIDNKHALIFNVQGKEFIKYVDEGTKLHYISFDGFIEVDGFYHDKQTNSRFIEEIISNNNLEITEHCPH